MSIAGIPYIKEHKLNHYTQRFEWDCGLSCIIMILPSPLRINFLRNFDQICKDEGFGCSTWTIDLCYILKKFHIKHIYLTKTIGVDPNYKTHSYYTRIIKKDEQRINEKFNKAESNGITIDQKIVNIEDFVQHLAKSGPIILLTNSTLLHCDICRQDKNLEKTRYKRYSGHYIVLCGYDLLRNKFYYRNPALGNHVCISSFDSLDKARTDYGTDEDVIFLFTNC